MNFEKILIKDYGKNSNKVIPKNNLNCNNCSECCTYLSVLTLSEFTKIINLIDNDKKLREFLFKRLDIINHQLFKNHTLNNPCIFSNSDNKCIIYKNRPYVCKWFHCDLKSKEFPINNYKNTNYTIISLVDYFINTHCAIPRIYDNILITLYSSLDNFIKNKSD